MVARPQQLEEDCAAAMGDLEGGVAANSGNNPTVVAESGQDIKTGPPATAAAQHHSGPGAATASAPTGNCKQDVGQVSGPLEAAERAQVALKAEHRRGSVSGGATTSEALILRRFADLESAGSAGHHVGAGRASASFSQHHHHLLSAAGSALLGERLSLDRATAESFSRRASSSALNMTTSSSSGSSASSPADLRQGGNSIGLSTSAVAAGPSTVNNSARRCNGSTGYQIASEMVRHRHHPYPPQKSQQPQAQVPRHQQATATILANHPKLPSVVGTSAAATVCGTSAAAGSSSSSPVNVEEPKICITVAPFTGGPFEVHVNREESVEDLKRVIARRLKVSKERIYLLYRESELLDGSISQNLLVDGSTVTLLPRAETGLISPKPEQSVMQALESLNEQQVNDFLSGAAPLNLTMRLGDHMMLIQLQLSTVNHHHHSYSSSRRKSSAVAAAGGSSSSSSSSSGGSSSVPASLPYPTPPPSQPGSPTPSTSGSSASPSPPPSTSSSSNGGNNSSSASSHHKVKVPLLSPGGLYGNQQAPPYAAHQHGSKMSSNHQQQQLHPQAGGSGQGQPPPAYPSAPQNQYHQHNGGSYHSRTSKNSSGSQAASIASASGSHSRAANFPSAPSTSAYDAPPAKRAKLDTRALAEASKNLTQTLKQLSSEVLITRPESGGSGSSSSSSRSSGGHAAVNSRSSSSAAPVNSGSSTNVAEHTHRPKKEERSSRKRRGGGGSYGEPRGAIIESMHHHGKGVYSGTFSGTLNPALQDANGQPKRDITTIVHILNDLLCAQYKAYNGSGRSSSRHHHHHHHHHKSSSSSGQDGSGSRSSGSHSGAAGGDPAERKKLEDQLNVTRTKIEVLKKIMEERRRRREARKLQQAEAARAAATPRPYSTAWSVKSSEAAQPSAAAGCGAEEAAGSATDNNAADGNYLKAEPEIVTA